jgi:RNA polymerase sigma factor (sigma-70 family)
MGFEEINLEINNRIQEIANTIHNKKENEQDLNELSRLIIPKLKYYIWKFCKNEYDTSEALQFALYKMFKNINKYNAEAGRFTTWAFTIAKHETLYYLDRKHKSIPKYIEIGDVYENIEHPFKLDSTDSELKSNQLCDLYNKTIVEIKNLQDDVLKNIALDKMVNNDKVKEIAEKYDMKENTVKTKLRKARFEVRKMVMRKNPDINEKLLDIIDDFKLKTIK